MYSGATSTREFMAYKSPVAPKSSSMFPGGRAWDDVRKEARKLEGELDVKVAAYAKLTSGFEANYRGRVGGDVSSLGADQLAQTKAAELEDLLHRLSDLNDEMGGLTGGISDTKSHTLARHRDILQDFNQEFRRLNSMLGSARDRVQLLAGSSDSAHIGIAMSGSSTGALLRERATVQSSTNAIDEVLKQAQSVSTSLLGDRKLFESMSDKLLQVGARFPMVNSVLNAIRRKKSKDTLVLGGVTAGCVLFTILYVMSK
mmetsp:Transcript_21582/g.36770  ORF Transcript_21582/g.36770 Transcript_21582/m.36770 type:complete len:258 (+) Transcript_21582:99-872(+)